MKPKVFYFTARTLNYEQSMSKFKGPISLKMLGIKDKIKSNDKVVIKTHFGALENVRYIRPSYIRFLCDYVKELGGRPVVAESCGWGIPESVMGTHTEYSGRSTEKEYLEVALQHGFTEQTMDAPIIMLDGPLGTDTERQKVAGKLFQEVQVAGRLREFDHLILATHFKGHAGSGFGGAIKNLGIGCVSKGGKVEAHTGKKFGFDFDKCLNNCEECIKICPTGALSKETGKVKIDWTKCTYCYMCNSVCKNEVIDIGESNTQEFITQMVDNAKGVVEYFGKDHISYVNYAIDITWQCDCTGGSDTPFVPDIGILSSNDPVALDQACIDLVHLSYMNPHSILGDIKSLKMDDKLDWFSYVPRFDPETGKYDFNLEGAVLKNWDFQLQMAEEIGLGTRDYELEEVIVTKKE